MDSKLLNKIEIAPQPSTTRTDIVFNWMDNPSVREVLDAVASIIADEYIQIAKQNPEVFSEIASPPFGVRNGNMKKRLPSKDVKFGS